MFRIETRNPPRAKLVKKQDPSPGCVRVWKHSPQDIALQIWCPNGRYTLVALSPAEARAIAEALVTEADKFLEPLKPGELETIVNEG